LFYNIANCYYKLQNWPEAILYYEKSLRLKPFFKDASFNLKLAKNNILDKEEEFVQSPFVVIGNFILNLFSVNGWIIIGIISFTFVCITIIILLLPSASEKLKIFMRKNFLWIFITGLIFTGFAVTKVLVFEKIRYAIIMKEEVEVLSGPSDAFDKLLTIHKGTKVRILQTEEGWIKINVSGHEGWIKEEELEII